MPPWWSQSWLPQWNLHEAHAALDQPPGDQAARAAVLRRGLVEAVQPVRRGRFLRDVERLLGGGLHPGGQLVAGDAGRQVVFAGALAQVLAVELLQVVAGTAPAARRRDVRRRIEIQDPRLARADDRALIERRQPAVGPVVDAEHRQAARIGEHDVRRQVLRSRCPGHRSARSRARAGRRWSGRRCRALIDWPWLLTPVCIERMSVMSSATSPRCGSSSRQLHAALAVRRELPRAAEQLGAGLGGVVVLDVAGEILQVPLGQLRLGVEQIDVARPALHEQRDHRPRLRLARRRLRRQVERRLLQRRLGGRGEQLVLVQQPGQGRASRCPAPAGRGSGGGEERIAVSSWSIRINPRTRNAFELNSAWQKLASACAASAASGGLSVCAGCGCELLRPARRGTPPPAAPAPSVGSCAKRQSPGQAHLRRRVVAGLAPSRARRSACDCAMHEVVVHQQQRLRRDGRAVAELAVGRRAPGRRTSPASPAAASGGPARRRCGGTRRRRATPRLPSRPAGAVAVVDADDDLADLVGRDRHRRAEHACDSAAADAARIASRIASASSRRTDMRPSRRLSGSTASSCARAPRRLAVGGRGHEQPVQPLQLPAAGHELGRPASRAARDASAARRARRSRPAWRRCRGRSGASRRGSPARAARSGCWPLGQPAGVGQPAAAWWAAADRRRRSAACRWPAPISSPGATACLRLVEVAAVEDDASAAACPATSVRQGTKSSAGRLRLRLRSCGSSNSFVELVDAACGRRGTRCRGRRSGSDGP